MYEPTEDVLTARAPQVERRQGYRQPIESTGLLRSVTTTDQSLSVPVHVFEVSISGVGFSCGLELAIGSVWRFDLSQKRQAARRIEIRSCRRRHDGMFDFGAMFC